MGDEAADFRQAKELGAEIVGTMQAYGDINGRVALLAFLDALVKVLQPLPADRQKVLAREFAEALFQTLKMRAKIVDPS